MASSVPRPQAMRAPPLPDSKTLLKFVWWQLAFFFLHCCEFRLFYSFISVDGRWCGASEVTSVGHKNITAKKETLWLIGLKFTTGVQQMLFAEDPHTRCTSGKTQTGLWSLLYCAPALWADPDKRVPRIRIWPRALTLSYAFGAVQLSPHLHVHQLIRAAPFQPRGMALFGLNTVRIKSPHLHRNGIKDSWWALFSI